MHVSKISGHPYSSGRRRTGRFRRQACSDICIWKAGIPDSCAILVSWIWQEIYYLTSLLEEFLLTQVESLPSLGRPQHALSKALCNVQ